MNSDGEPREMYRVVVDLQRWIAEDPGPQGPRDSRYCRREHPTSSHNDYRQPIYTISRQQVVAIIKVFGADYVRVEYADLGALSWSGPAWPRPKALPVVLDCEAWRMVCPHCGAADAIAEVDVNIRRNAAKFGEAADGAGGAIVFAGGDFDPKTLRRECGVCFGEVTFPEGSMPDYV